MGKSQKRIALILCVCFVLVSILSLVTIASHAGHACTGEHCEICLFIARLQNTFQHFGAAMFAVAFLLAAAFILAPFVEKGRPNRTGTLIFLRVQLNI